MCVCACGSGSSDLDANVTTDRILFQSQVARAVILYVSRSLCVPAPPRPHPSRLPEFKCRRISEHGPFALEASHLLCLQKLSPDPVSRVWRRTDSDISESSRSHQNGLCQQLNELLDSAPGSAAAGSLDDGHARHHAISILASVPNPTMQQGVPSGSRRRALRPVPTLILAAGGLPVTDTSLGSKDNGEPSTRT